MRILRLFNPENDLALAAGSACYTPPPAAALLRSAGALLPMWLADEGDFLLAPREFEDTCARMRERFGLHSSILTPESIDRVNECSPWGWSAATRRAFIKAGIRERALPDSAQIERLRALSHRRTAAQLLEKFGFADVPVEARDRETALAAIDALEGEAYIKLPWSSSGRGVFAVSGMSRSKLIEYIDGFIRRQGSVIVEKAYRKQRDFAMLFYSMDNKVTYAGLSLFDTLPGGAYSSNILLPQSEIERTLGIDAAILSAKVGQALEEIVAPVYTGPLGVDMLLTEDGAIVPGIEINLRYTMGFIALAVEKRLGSGIMTVAPGVVAAGSINLSPVPGAAFSITFRDGE